MNPRRRLMFRNRAKARNASTQEVTPPTHVVEVLEEVTPEITPAIEVAPPTLEIPEEIPDPPKATIKRKARKTKRPVKKSKIN